MTEVEELRAKIAELEQTLEQIQYRRHPFESPSHWAERRPWHSPRCYEKSGSNRDRNLCTCGLTSMQDKVSDVERAIFEAVSKKDAEWRERVQLRANQMDAPNGPECWCGNPSAHQSGECLDCAGTEESR